ncbi:MAG: N-acetylmuramoyl-L-alanine amidase, partial [Candidatus Hydrogenedentes bacterium]|nr:N-acetylmuramoyl-L-alanine amidase [Candidatus Hydrogenedentota bacterium]
MKVYGLLAISILCAAEAYGGEPIYAPVEPGLVGVLRDGRQLFAECRLPKGTDAATFFEKYLANPQDAQRYKERMSVALRFDQLNAETRHKVLLCVFKQDVVDEAGWWHTASCEGKEGQESLWALCEWVTGKGTNYRKVMADKRNHAANTVLEKGQRVLIPAALLLEIMKQPLPKPEETPLTEDTAKPADEEPANLDALAAELKYGSDAQGPYAVYRLKSGEALYTAVVVRFTDIRDNEDLLKACDVVQRRSGIRNVRDMQTGQRILIPLEMLSDRFKPEGDKERKDYDETIVEAKRLRKERLRTKDLEGVVVVLDPGHGGRDHGAEHDKSGLYEYALNYDIVCRVKQLLETRTHAKVYVTVKDFKRGYETSDARRFSADNNVTVLTTPHYENVDAKISANLRWYLANSIYRAEAKKGVEPRKMVFTSFHTDALFDGRLRGAMIYLPGAKYRREREEPDGAIYERFKEAKEQRAVSASLVERRRDEALSR